MTAKRLPTRRLALLLIGGLITFGSAASPPQPGEFPPPLDGTDQHGVAADLAALRGHVVVLTFWASWCGPCLNEMSMLARLQGVADERDLDLSVVSVNYKEDVRRFKALARALSELPLRLVQDADGSNAGKYEVDRIPNMFLIGRDGRIVSHHVGYTDRALDGLLAEITAELQKPVVDAM